MVTMGGLKIEEETEIEEKGKQNTRDITPVDRAFHESLILRDRWNVGKLYANNIFQGQNYRRQVRNMAHHRANKLYGIDQDIDNMKRRIENIIIQKDSLRYLPTEKEYAQIQLAKEKKKQRVRVVPDPRHQSVIILPPIYKTVPGRGSAKKSKDKSNKKQNKNKRKPLHAPKHLKTKIDETPRQRRYKREYVEHDTPLMSSASTSVISSYPDSVRTYYPSSVTTGELISIRESPFKYGSLYGKSSFKIHNDFSTTHGENKDDNKRSSYNKRFYEEKDFKATKPRYIPKNMRSSNGYNHNFLTS